MNYKEAARDFIENEKQFHLGVIPTEQSNPITRNLSTDIKKSTAAGVKTILAADVNIAPVARKAFESENFNRMVADIRRVMDEKKHMLFSSVGASGRLAIQLNGAWRDFWTSLAVKIPAKASRFYEIADCCDSFTTGGDRALVHSVENFEDYMTFGARQVVEAGIGEGDVLIGLAECGLSASINGSVIEGDKRGCTTYYLYCNPKEILCEHLERVRMVFARENIIPIPIFVGNMAVAGSTRMQVTTVELLVAGAALEMAAGAWLKDNLTEDEFKVVGTPCLTGAEYADWFEKLNAILGSGEALEGLAKAVDYEAETYTNKGRITYLTHDYLLDILTDTTERQPTFTLPPFRKFLDKEGIISWAYAKDPLYPNEVAWQHIFRRPIKGLEWKKEDYIEMKAAQAIIDNPPKVSGEEVFQYCIGNEDDDSRYGIPYARLVGIDINGSGVRDAKGWFNANKDKFDGSVFLRFGDIPEEKLAENEIRIPAELPRTCTDLLTHLLIKLSFNILSTATMAKMGRVWSNWMIQVLPTNKKLIDRSTRVISTLANIPYETACEEFFKSMLGRKPGEEYRESYVVETLKRLGFDPDAPIK